MYTIIRFLMSKEVSLRKPRYNFKIKQQYKNRHHQLSP